MDIRKAIKFLEKKIKNPSVGLPEEVFLFISKITPMINVDLLIKDEKGRTLLSWRDDKYQKGWHVPGGIIRFKEKAETRILKVAKQEIGAKIKFDHTPIAIYQLMAKQDTRGHFIYLLYKCFLSSRFPLKNRGLSSKDPGYLKWHDTCPSNLLKVQKIYRKYI
ncbi:NUDIX hydrolase [Patescibacteria group bacterium]|nr:NUDIX hydrolase [Patescibacteria group bacterium]